MKNGMRVRHLSGVAFALMILLISPACNRSEPPRSDSSPATDEIIVSAAASLRDAFREIGALHESRTGTRAIFNFGASGALQRQIETGAPADVFASAGQPQMNALAAQNLIIAETRRSFTRNTLVLIVPTDSAFGALAFADLGDARVRRIAVGNPRTVPAGQYAEQSLVRLGLWPQIQSRLILAEDVRQVLDYVARGEVDAGIVYASDARAAQDRVRIAARAPAETHDPILYPVAVVRDSRRTETARRFVETVLSAEGQAVLSRHGFEAVR